MSRILVSLLIVSLFLQVPFALAAESRSGAQLKQKAAGSKPLAQTTPASSEHIAFLKSLTPADEARLVWHIKGELVARLYRTATNLEMYERTFFPFLKKEDQAALQRELKSLKFKDRPAVEFREGLLIARAGKDEIRFELVDHQTAKFRVNGLSWVYDRQAPLMPQLDLLTKKLQLKAAGRDSVFLQLLMPTAHAVVPLMAVVAYVGPALVGVTVGMAMPAARDFVYDWWCHRKIEVLKKEIAPEGACYDYYKRLQEAKMKGAPALDAVYKQIASDAENVLEKFEARERKCPDKNDGKERVYHARIRSRERTPGAKDFVNGPWFSVYSSLKPDGTPDYMYMLPEDVDPTAPDAKDKAMARYKFNADRLMTEVEVANPSYTPANAIMTPRFITLRRGSANLTPEQEGQLRKLEDVLVYVNFKVTQCVIQKVDLNQVQGIENGSPVQPVAEAGAGAQAAPAGPANQKDRSR